MQLSASVSNCMTSLWSRAKLQHCYNFKDNVRASKFWQLWPLKKEHIFCLSWSELLIFCSAFKAQSVIHACLQKLSHTSLSCLAGFLRKLQHVSPSSLWQRSRIFANFACTYVGTLQSLCDVTPRAQLQHVRRDHRILLGHAQVTSPKDLVLTHGRVVCVQITCLSSRDNVAVFSWNMTSLPHF